ncbi:MAG TPA: 4-(cytidine 5'-diphospho)-2-C-methyl-D-erythritol kinase [Bdellovibrionota bacterium]|nr:4-(cytidine 5'-diphospho)-2-C-methyl-D-erythritol kinase [Bdellovibrionota bacterium]
MRLDLKSPCKINLILRVFERRADGYHRVETVMVKLALHDDIVVGVEEGDGILVRVPANPVLENDQNLAVRAARLFCETSGKKARVTIEITKRIPVAGGLGGGSSNGAAVLLALQKSLGGISDDLLLKMGLKLGADVPFFIQPGNWGIGRGIGDDIRPWQSLPSRPIVLVNPGFPVPTAKVYRALGRPLTPEVRDGNSSALRKEPKSWSDLKGLFSVGNDLQAAAEKLYPDIQTIRVALSERGADFAQMSGSGGSVFGLFSERKKAESAANDLQKRWKIVIVTETAADG